MLYVLKYIYKTIQEVIMKTLKKDEFRPTRYFKAYLKEVKNKETGNVESQVKCVFSEKPFSAEQFMSLMMGVMEAYAQQLLVDNTPENVYDNFNNAFGIFLAKLVPQEYIYEHSESHKAFKEHVDNTLGGEEDVVDSASNKMAAYLLAHDILVKEVGLDEDSANLVLNRRLGLLRTESEHAEEKESKSE